MVRVYSEEALQKLHRNRHSKNYTENYFPFISKFTKINFGVFVHEGHELSLIVCHLSSNTFFSHTDSHYSSTKHNKCYPQVYSSVFPKK